VLSFELKINFLYFYFIFLFESCVELKLVVYILMSPLRILIIVN